MCVSTCMCGNMCKWAWLYVHTCVYTTDSRQHRFVQIDTVLCVVVSVLRVSVCVCVCVPEPNHVHRQAGCHKSSLGAQLSLQASCSWKSTMCHVSMAHCYYTHLTGKMVADDLLISISVSSALWISLCGHWPVSPPWNGLASEAMDGLWLEDLCSASPGTVSEDETENRHQAAQPHLSLVDITEHLLDVQNWTCRLLWVLKGVGWAGKIL